MLILGCGYIGRRIARHYRDKDAEPVAIVRTGESRAALETDGIPARAHDLAEPWPDSIPLAGQAVFHLVPPPASGREDGHTRAFVQACREHGAPSRLVYIGTTGVYGDCGGAWVDETRPIDPRSDRSWRRADAENVLNGYAADSGMELVVLRVAGIYGPGRLPLARLRSGQPVVHPEDTPYSNRIHTDDLVQTCVAAMERGRGIYNACDGNPSTMTDYFYRVADAAGLPRPEAIRLDEAKGRLSAGMMTYMSESRRLDNRRLVHELGVRLRYPTLEAGLAASLAAEGDVTACE